MKQTLSQIIKNNLAALLRSLFHPQPSVGYKEGLILNVGTGTTNEGNMTKKQFRAWKKNHLLKRKELAINDRPVWADDEKQEIEDKNWLIRFKEELHGAIALRDQTT